MRYIDHEHDNMNRALSFAVCMAICELLARLGHMSSDHLQLQNANTLRSALNGIIYRKIFRFSSATNKKFKKGDINNLIDKDLEKACLLMWQIPHMVNIPSVVLMCTFTLYTIVGHL